MLNFAHAATGLQVFSVSGARWTIRLSLFQVLADTRALMVNGFVLDELPGPLVVAAAQQTRRAGGSVFFDPGVCSIGCIQQRHMAAEHMQPQGRSSLVLSSLIGAMPGVSALLMHTNAGVIWGAIPHEL